MTWSGSGYAADPAPNAAGWEAWAGARRRRAARSPYLRYRPQLVKAKIVAGATDPISDGYDKVGSGGIDCASAQWNSHWFWWSGGACAFSAFDGQDGAADNYPAKTVYISKSCDRVQRHPTVRSPEVDDLSVVTNVYKRGLKAILIDKLCIILAVDLYKVPRPNAFSVGQ